jgi:hypothetical protein
MAHAAGAGRAGTDPLLVDVFGFEETAVYGDGERVDHAELAGAAAFRGNGRAIVADYESGGKRGFR